MVHISGHKGYLSQIQRLLSASAISSASMLLVLTYAPTVMAQTQAAATASESYGLEEVVVTARKRSEKLQDVPESVTAVTSATIDQRNLTTLNDIVRLTPSLAITNYSAERIDPNQQSLTLRGVNGLATASGNGTGIFINGAPTINGFATDISELERVEVLKGPQSAYFGRATFAGAINYVTRTPSDDLKGSVEALFGSNNWKDVRGSIEGAVVPGVLSFRVNARGFFQDGQYRSVSDGSTVQNQQTTSAAAVLDYHGLDNLKVTLTALYRENNDGVPAYAKFNSLSGNFNCAAGGGTPATAVNYICGQLPSFPTSQIGSDFPLTAATRGILFGNSAGIPNPSNLPLIDYAGTTSHTGHANIHADYSLDNTGTMLDGVTLTYVGAIEDFTTNFLTNSEGQSLQNVPNPSYGKVANVTPYDTFLISGASGAYDMYHEFRASSDQSQRFRWTQGVSYYYQGQPVPITFGIIPTGVSNFGGSGSTTTTENWGAFGSLAFDILPELVAEFDWRFQVDHLTVDAHYAPAHQFASDLDPEFMPRGSLQYKIAPNLTAYTSYAIGINPQSFNTTLFGLPSSVLATIQAGTGAGLAVKGEHIEMYELGFKGNLFDGRLAFDTDIYYGNWTNQVVSQPIVAPNVIGGVIQPVTTIYRPNTNLGRSEVWGYELQGGAKIIPNLTANITLGVNETQIDSYNCQACITVNGSTYVKGNALPGVPEITATAFLEYRDQLPFWSSDFDWYLNGQYVHKDGVFTDQTNIAYTGPQDTFDFRLGVESDRYSIEGFVLNAFNDYYYTSAQRDTNIAPGLPNAIYVGLPLLRQYGVRLKYKFDAGHDETPTTAAYVPPPAVAPKPASTARSYQVFFDFNKSDLTPQAVTIVDTAAKNAGPAKVTQIEVTGHTDTVGSDAYNMRLSRRRAESVAAELEKQGIPSSEIAIFAKGKKDLLVPTADGVKEPQNRRVQIVYAGGPMS